MSTLATPSLLLRNIANTKRNNNDDLENEKSKKDENDGSKLVDDPLKMSMHDNSVVASTKRQQPQSVQSDTNLDQNCESKHFLSLKMFTKHAEPSIQEFLSSNQQEELELKHREEEDTMYRSFLLERKQIESTVLNMNDNDRLLVFADLNLKERSRMINLSEKHCCQMMDLIYREKIKYLTENCEISDAIEKYPRDSPKIQPTVHSKEEVYEDNMSVFEAVDDTAIKMASMNFGSYTSLVRELTGKFSSDIDKARAIFRFMAEKKFDQLSWFLYYPNVDNTRGAPTNLFRSVEFGIESKAFLFKRLCSYAGLHSIVIKGFCKGKNYIPGEKFVDNRYRNTWNAVFVAGEWRLIQANWATLQVNLKATRETKATYQDHYFLADPDKFIFEFIPIREEFQFLKHPITMSEFEDLPLLRSTFFQYGLNLSRSEGLLKSVLTTNEIGEAKLYFKSDKNLSYHYTITNKKTGSSSIKIGRTKYPLNRFAMMYMVENEATFNIFLPVTGEFILEIGVAKYPKLEECMQKPVHYINSCKFLIICGHTNKNTAPLPDCVPGEWGPRKAFELFGLRATSHPLFMISAAPPSNIDFNEEVRPLTLNIEFQKTCAVLDFLTVLYKNDGNTLTLRQGARYRNKENYVIFDIKVPQEGQYGLDIYARRSWSEKMLHCCKYLINCDG